MAGSGYFLAIWTVTYLKYFKKKYPATKTTMSKLLFL